MKRWITVAGLSWIALGSSVGHADVTHLFDTPTSHPLLRAADVGLIEVWKRELGSSYSSVAVADGHAVTMYSDGSSDFVVSLDSNTGKQRWRHRLGDTYKGHDGSHDGALSSPVIADGTVYALDAKGQLVALGLAEGTLRWSVQLTESFGAEKPFYGFTTTPLVTADSLVVAVGGSEGRTVCGLSLGDGSKRWCRDAGAIIYQSPAPASFHGNDLAVAVTSTHILGLDPRDGTEHWSFEHGSESASSANPMQVSDDLLLVNFRDAATLYRVIDSDGTLRLEQQLRTEELSGSWAAPYYHEGHLYGFKREILHCIDAASGERKWRSRPPGGRGMIGIDGHLMVLGQRGTVTLVAAKPDRYQEKASLGVLSAAGWTKPTFADGKIFVRDLEGIAAVALRRGASRNLEAATAPAPGNHAFGRWLRELESQPNKIKAVDAFLKRHDSLPIVENDRWVHFIYRGDAEEVAVMGSMSDNGWEPLHRVAGTDLFHRSYAIESGARWEYRFQVDMGDSVLDPLNRESAPATWDETGYSVVRTSGYELPSFLTAAEPKRTGRIDVAPFASKMMENERELKVYLPAGYDKEAKRRYPVVFVENASQWVDKGRLPELLDRMIDAGRIPPTIVVLLTHPEGAFFPEAWGGQVDRWSQALADEVVPFIDGRYRTLATRQSRMLWGHNYSATVVLLTAVEHPEVFGAVATQSANASTNWQERIHQGLADLPKGTRVYLDWSRYEERSIDSATDLRVENRALAEAARRGDAELLGGEVLDGHGWSGWTARSGAILGTLIPR